MGSNGLQCILTNFGAKQYCLILSQVYFKLLLLQKPGNLHTESWPTDQYILHEHNTCSFSDKFLQWLFTFIGLLVGVRSLGQNFQGPLGSTFNCPTIARANYLHLHKSKSTCTNAHIHYHIELHFVTSCKKALYCEHCQNMECWNFQCCENCVQLNTICGACI